MRARARALPLLGLLLLTSACDLTGGPTGEFVGTVRGNLSLPLRWGGTFGSSDAIVFSGDEAGAVYVGPFDARMVGPGRYPIGRASDENAPSTNPDTFTAALLFNRGQGHFVSEYGELILVAVTAEEVRGSLQFAGVDVRDSTRTVLVEGRFRAVYVPSRG